MKAIARNLSLSLLTASVFSAPMVFAEETAVSSGIKQALSDSKVNVSFRARYEGVDQDDIDDKANALTVKSRLTVKTGAYQGLSVGVEVDNVTALAENYNSTRNGETKYPVVADPEGTDVNQGFLQYKAKNTTVTAGRQRILHNNQRFVGGVAWRQNEQTYDGYRVEFAATDALSFDYSYVYNVNRIFGPDGDKANLHGGFHFVNAKYNINKAHKLTGFGYVLDFDSAAALSTSTYGMLYNGSFGAFNVNASYATQSDNGDNPTSFDANYYNAEVGYKIEGVTLLGGLEVLGSDNGVGFSTPLATLHKFQGFSDKFLSTPGTGIEDVYITVKSKVSGVALSATFHDLSSDEGDIDYGTEIDVAAGYKFDKNYNVLVKLASYSADDHATDTTKLWLQLQAKF